jgi:uncharacterized membrane protein YecN with MAPEG domain
MLLHALGVMLVTGRLVHAFGLSRSKEFPGSRVAEMALTFACYLLAAGFLLWREAVRTAP